MKKYYSRTIFWLLIIIAILAVAFRFYYLQVLLALAAFTYRPTSFDQFINFIYLVQFPLIILFICLQQRINKKWGYFIVVCTLFSYLIYTNTGWDPFVPFVSFFILENLIPFYVVGRLVYEDFFKKIK